jgi:hypothetical protein
LIITQKKLEKKIKNSGFLTFIDFLRNEIDGNIKLHSRIRNNIFHIKVVFS